MNKKMINDEIKRNRKKAEDYFNDWTICKATILEVKAIRCLEIAEALEMSLDIIENDEKIKELEEKIKHIEKGLEMVLMLPEEMRMSKVSELLSEVRR